MNEIKLTVTVDAQQMRDALSKAQDPRVTVLLAMVLDLVTTIVDTDADYAMGAEDYHNYYSVVPVDSVRNIKDKIHELCCEERK